MKKLDATITALVTPFSAGQVDTASLEALLRQQLDAGVEGFVINGTTAESPVLSSKEKEQVFALVRNFTGGSATLIMGTGSNSTLQTVEDSRRAQELGADALLVVVPYYNKPPQRGLFQHFKTVADSVETPVLLYNVPGRTITSLQTETIRLLSEVRNIVGIKEATGNIEFAKEIRQTCGPDFILLSGDDGSYVEFLQASGQGVISVASHILPQQMLQWKKWVLAGELEKARNDIQKYSRLIDLLFSEANPIPVKMALFFMGLIKSSELRLPLVDMDGILAQDLKLEMKKVGVL